MNSLPLNYSSPSKHTIRERMVYTPGKKKKKDPTVLPHKVGTLIYIPTTYVTEIINFLKNQGGFSIAVLLIIKY